MKVFLFLSHFKNIQKYSKNIYNRVKILEKRKGRKRKQSMRNIIRLACNRQKLFALTIQKYILYQI